MPSIELNEQETRMLLNALDGEWQTIEDKVEIRDKLWRYLSRWYVEEGQNA